MSNDFRHNLLNLITAITLHLYEAEDCDTKKTKTLIGEHITKALHITKQLDTFIREDRSTK